jgi:hypothetical protein
VYTLQTRVIACRRVRAMSFRVNRFCMSCGVDCNLYCICHIPPAIVIVEQCTCYASFASSVVYAFKPASIAPGFAPLYQSPCLRLPHWLRTTGASIAARTVLRYYTASLRWYAILTALQVLVRSRSCRFFLFVRTIIQVCNTGLQLTHQTQPCVMVSSHPRRHMSLIRYD